MAPDTLAGVEVRLATQPAMTAAEAEVRNHIPIAKPIIRCGTNCATIAKPRPETRSSPMDWKA
ncbi:Uncharacterised protein [Vibrio cholerae]|nr:Uncharacterised protein [Vibrio cholerae]